ncbi:MAG TPA: hypothetical protein VIS99_05035, partial [Terrimicrobiaceae bacterium]
MKTRFGMLASCLTLAALVAADAQIEVPPAPTPAPAPAATPAAGPAARRSVLDESQPSAVTAPGPDAQFDAAGLPLEPQSTGPEVQPLVQPESGEAVIAEEATAEAPLRRRWRIAPVFSAGVVYDDNIFLSNVDRVADIIWNFSVGFAFELGDFRGGAVSLGERRGGTENYLIAGWIGVPVFYTNNSAQNAFNQYAYLGLQYRWTKLVAIFDSSFSIVKGASREISQIITTTTFANSLRFNYDYSEKTLIKLDFRQWASFTDAFQDQNQYEIRAGMTYQIMPKTKIGPEFAVGTSASTDSPFSYYEQVLGTTTWTPTPKFTFRFAGGLEIRQVEGGDPPVRFGPIFSLGMEYHPFDGTSV